MNESKRYFAVYVLAPFWEFGQSTRRPRFFCLDSNLIAATRIACSVKEVLNVPAWVAEMPEERPAHITVQQRFAEGRI